MRRRRELLRRYIPRANYERYLTSEEAAFATLFGTSADDYAQLSAREGWPPSFQDTGGYLSCLDGSPDPLRVIAAAVRLVQPDIMVATGVARGASSAVALAAMQGLIAAISTASTFRLLLPTATSSSGERWPITSGTIGRCIAVPRAKSFLGYSDRTAGNIDIFLHDADHTYRSIFEEYRQAWPSLRAGGLLLSDDAKSTGAFLDFAARVGYLPFMITDQQGIATVGVLLKPAHES